MLSLSLGGEGSGGEVTVLEDVEEDEAEAEIEEDDDGEDGERESRHCCKAIREKFCEAQNIGTLINLLL